MLPTQPSPPTSGILIYSSTCPPTHPPVAPFPHPHTGDITVESTLGVGSTFTVWLPISQEEAKRASIEHRQEMEEAVRPRR